MTLTSKGERTRQHILAQATTLFNTKGYAGTSMSDITAATGLSKGAVYANYDSKESLAVAAFQHAVEEVGIFIRQYTKPEKGTLSKLKAVVSAYRDYVADPPVLGGCPILNMAVESDDVYPWMRKIVLEAVETWVSRLTFVLERGKEEGQVRSDLDSLSTARAFVGMLEGGILLSRLAQDGSYFEPIAKQLLQLIEDAKA